MRGSFKSVARSISGGVVWGLGAAAIALGNAACGPQNPGMVSLGRDASGIIGGEDATGQEDFAKTVVALYNTSRRSLCTASILSDSTLLTAAHCVSNAAPTDLVAIFNPDLRGNDLVARRVSKKAVSELWETNQDNEVDTGDIALVKFVGGLPEGFRPARVLAEADALNDGGEVMLAGYGISDGVSRTGSKVLRFVTTQIKNKAFARTEVLLDQTAGRGACHGDSGGPAYVKVNGELRLFGVTSRGVNDQNDDCSKFSAYTNVLAYQEWIERASRALLETPVARREQPTDAGPIAAAI